MTQKIKGIFYPLQYQEWKKACQELTLSQLNVLYLIRTLDPYSNGIDVSPTSIAKELSTDEKPVYRSTVSRALHELHRKGFIDLELLSVRVKATALGLHCSEDVTVCEDNKRDQQTTTVIATQPACPTDNKDIYIDRVRELDIPDLIQTSSDLIFIPNPEISEGEEKNVEMESLELPIQLDDTLIEEPKVLSQAIDPQVDLNSVGQSLSDDKTIKKHEFRLPEMVASLPTSITEDKSAIAVIEEQLASQKGMMLSGDIHCVQKTENHFRGVVIPRPWRKNIKVHNIYHDDFLEHIRAKHLATTDQYRRLGTVPDIDDARSWVSRRDRDNQYEIADIQNHWDKYQKLKQPKSSKEQVSKDLDEMGKNLVRERDSASGAAITMPKRKIKN